MHGGTEALLDRLEAGIACGSAVEALLAELERVLVLDAVVIAREGRGRARVRERRTGQALRWWATLAPLAFDELARCPLGRCYVWSRGPGAPRALPRSAAIVELGPPVLERLAVGLLRAHGTFRQDEVLLLRWLAPSLERTFSGLLARRALSAPFDETIEDVIAGSAASATISLRRGTIEWSRFARELFHARLGASLASVAPMVLRAATDGRERLLPGGLCVAFVYRGTREEPIALFHDHSVLPSASPRALHLADELLSPRQRQVARRVAAGESLRAVAAELGIRQETARAHLSAAYDRLGIRNRARLALTLAEATLR